MPPANQRAQRGLFEQFGANVRYVVDENEGHSMASNIPSQAFAWVYGNLGVAGIDKDEERAADDNWA